MIADFERDFSACPLVELSESASEDGTLAAEKPKIRRNKQKQFLRMQPWCFFLIKIFYFTFKIIN